MAAALDASARVALVGLGNMGLAIAERLLDGGYRLAVHNRTPGPEGPLLGRGATRLDSPAGALAANDVCLLALSDDAAVEQVAAAVLGGAVSGTVLVETSTISAAASARIAAVAAAHEIGYLRAPFSGNPAAIRSGTAVLFVSGRVELAARVDPVLRAVTPTVRYVGEGERARALKLVLQVMVGGTAGLLGEAIVLGEASGLDRRTLLDVIGASVVGSRFVEYKSEPLVRGDYSPTFTTAMMRKDVGLVLDLAGDTGVELPLTDALGALVDAACEDGHADQDFSALVLELEERAGARRTAEV
jgi:3-hydroxyisobutyrate dehydrogenase